jgi:putative flippase GtrA
VIQEFVSRQFVAFLVTGGAAAGVNFGSRIVYNRWMDFSPAVIFAYITGMITAFILAKIFVFKASTQSMGRSAFFFTLVNIFAVAQTWVISMGLAYYLLPWCGIVYLEKEIAHGVGVLVPAFTSYLGHKYWSFR